MRENLNKCLIFSPTEGFWQSDFGWSSSTEEADVIELTDADLNDPRIRPVIHTSGDDAVYALQSKTLSFDYDELTKYIVKSLLSLEGEAVAGILADEFDFNVAYAEDSVWILDGERTCQDELSKVTTEALNGYEAKSLIKVFEARFDGTIYSDPLGEGVFVILP